MSYRDIRNGSRCHSWHGNCDLALWLGAGTGSPSFFCKIDTSGTHLSGIQEVSRGTVNRSWVFILGKEAAVQWNKCASFHLAPLSHFHGPNTRTLGSPGGSREGSVPLSLRAQKIPREFLTKSPWMFEEGVMTVRTHTQSYPAGDLFLWTSWQGFKAPSGNRGAGPTPHVQAHPPPSWLSPTDVSRSRKGM